MIIDAEALTFPKRVIHYKEPVSGEIVETEVYLSAEPSKDSVIVLCLHGFATRAWKVVLAVANALTGNKYVFVDVPRFTSARNTAAWDKMGLRSGESFLLQTALQIQAMSRYFAGHHRVIITHSIGNELFRYLLLNLGRKFNMGDGRKRELLKQISKDLPEIPTV